jgi:hypothetical protein
MHPISQTILLLRISRLGVVDPLAELDNVIARRGASWFGKVGIPAPILSWSIQPMHHRLASTRLITSNSCLQLKLG